MFPNLFLWIIRRLWRIVYVEIKNVKVPNEI